MGVPWWKSGCPLELTSLGTHLIHCANPTTRGGPFQNPVGFQFCNGGGETAAIAYALIDTAKLNGVNPDVWLTGDLGRIADHKIINLGELLPWR